MFGDLLGSFEQKQQEMLDKAAAIVVESEVGGVRVTANGKNEIFLVFTRFNCLWKTFLFF